MVKKMSDGIYVVYGETHFAEEYRRYCGSIDAALRVLEETRVPGKIKRIVSVQNGEETVLVEDKM